MLIIVTDNEFLVARITDGVDSPSVTKTATRIDLESIDLCSSSLVDLEPKEATMASTFIHSFIINAGPVHQPQRYRYKMQ